jgi:hypothetical protein
MTYGRYLPAGIFNNYQKYRQLCKYPLEVCGYESCKEYLYSISRSVLATDAILGPTLSVSMGCLTMVESSAAMPRLRLRPSEFHTSTRQAHSFTEH